MQLRKTGDLPCCPCSLPLMSPHAGEELADVLLYLVRLSDACGIDLAAAAQAKLRKNAGKRSWDQGRGAQLSAARRA